MTKAERMKIIMSIFNTRTRIFAKACSHILSKLESDGYVMLASEDAAYRYQDGILRFFGISVEVENHIIRPGLKANRDEVHECEVMSTKTD